MSSLIHNLLFTSALLVTVLNLFLPASCIDRWPHSTSQTMLMEDKVRLGSTPPSCHNRCNTCNPCTALHVPTLPSWRPAAAEKTPSSRASPRHIVDQPNYSQYSNYKPLGWKCRCGDRMFNP